MIAVEFHTKVIDGKIEIPKNLRKQFQGEVDVILFAEVADSDGSAWPGQKRRRWELLARNVRQGLTAAEKQELATLEQRADERLARVGPRPLQEFERLYAQLSQEG